MIDILCKDIVQAFKINRIVETGTDKGETVAEVSRWLAEMDSDFGTIIAAVKTGARSYNSWNEPIAYPVFSQTKVSRCQIHSVEVDSTSYQTAKKNFQSNSNIYLYHSDSVKFLNSLLSAEMGRNPSDHRYLFFLDAHWGKYWPLRDELKVIRKLNKYLIVIDDFMVPGKSHPSRPRGAFGFDVYQGKILHWSYLCDVFTDTAVKIFYPNRPNRDRRGWVLITHGYSKNELGFLETLPLFEIDQSDEGHTTPVESTWRVYLDGKHIFKKIVPMPVLRSMHRLYEKILYYSCS